MTLRTQNGTQMAQMMSIEEINKLTGQIIALAIMVHKNIGPGFNEKIYEKALAQEFKKADIKFLNQPSIKVEYETIPIGKQRLDFLVENEVVVEIKSVSKIIKIFESQLISYLKASGKRVGLILNFGRKRLEIKRKVNKL